MIAYCERIYVYTYILHLMILYVHSYTCPWIVKNTVIIILLSIHIDLITITISLSLTHTLSVSVQFNSLTFRLLELLHRWAVVSSIILFRTSTWFRIRIGYMWNIKRTNQNGNKRMNYKKRKVLLIKKSHVNDEITEERKIYDGIANYFRCIQSDCESRLEMCADSNAYKKLELKEMQKFHSSSSSSSHVLAVASETRVAWIIHFQNRTLKSIYRNM